MKKLMLTMLGMTGLCVVAAPQRHPIYEFDGKSLQPNGNLFLNAKVVASGQYSTYAPKFAVDGERKSSESYWAAENIPQSLTIDMGQPKKLSQIVLVPYWKDGRAYGFKIEGSTDGQTWQLLVDKTTNRTCAKEKGFALDFAPANVRYVRTTMTHNTSSNVSGAHIVEIEGYAEARGTGCSFLAGDIHTRYDRDVRVNASALAPVAKLTGWRGERVNTLLVASSDTGFAELRLAAKDPKAQLNVLRYTLGNGTLYGDILDGTTQTTFKGVTRPVVYTYDIPTDASGVIRDTVTATINGVVCALPVEITVVPRTLPAVKDWKFHLDFWQHADPIARWHDVPMWSDAHFELLKAYYRPLVEMGQKTITTTLIDEAWNQQTYDRYRSCVEATKHIDGTWSYDYTNFDKLVTCMTELGVTGQIDCYSMLPWSLAFRYFDEKSNCSVAPRMEPGSAAYEDFWGHLLTDFCHHLEAKGWFGRTKIALDERPDKLIKPALAVLRKYAPGLEMVMACNTPSKLNAEMFDVAYSYGHCPGLAKFAAERRAKGKFTTFYICCGPARPNTFLTSDPAESEWLAPFAAAMDFDGLLRWAWCSWVKDPLETQDFTAWPTGDTSLIYPGPRLSLRALLVRDGIETFEKIRILGRDNLPALKTFTAPRGGQRGVHASDVRALSAEVNAIK
ncbi:MAG: discoidin domain-containing protein [Kiritimatiellae bacterium]|nr:discoidin domain-containing protein [Kiritimatiellia bacterium]